MQDLALLDVMKRCLQRNPADRPSITGAKGLLQHPFLHPERISGMLYPHLSSAAADDIEIACQETSAFLRRATAAVSAAAAAAATATATTTAVVTTTAAATACDGMLSCGTLASHPREHSPAPGCPHRRVCPCRVSQSRRLRPLMPLRRRQQLLPRQR
jgi:hypothetical protein